MMKKLLIFMLVLGMASMANATLQISVDGVKEPVDSQIVVMPSDYLVLDIWTDTEISPGVGEWGIWALGADIAKATISGGVSLIPDPGVVIYNDARASGVLLPDAEDGVWGMLGLATVPSIAAGATIFDEILFHCEEVGDVTVTVYGSMDGVTYTPLDSVVIHQIPIPEPATIALLGLGGLLLRRRKKQQTA